MTLLTGEDAPRVARLARLRLSAEEVRRLAPALEAITRDFSSLAERADGLPAPADAPAGAARADEVAASSPQVVGGILRAAGPRADAATHTILTTPRGNP